MIDMGPIKKIMAEIRGFTGEIVSLVLILIIATSLASLAGFKIPYIPKLDGLNLVYTCAAFWFWRGGKLT